MTTSAKKPFLVILYNTNALNCAVKHFPKIDFKNASATALPFENASIDLVITWTVLQHIPPSHITTAIDEIKRVRKSSGTVLLCEATKYPDRFCQHTFDRDVQEYERLFAPLRLTYSSFITELDFLPELGSPGRIMLFEP
jgi:ubiquinone/menaquinone biosynthesis C-methylase UbiE